VFLHCRQQFTGQITATSLALSTRRLFLTLAVLFLCVATLLALLLPSKWLQLLKKILPINSPTKKYAYTDIFHKKKIKKKIKSKGNPRAKDHKYWPEELSLSSHVLNVKTATITVCKSYEVTI